MRQKFFSKLKISYRQLPLVFVFIAFGYLLVAQINTQSALSGSLEAQTIDNLSIIAINLSQNNQQLENELNSLQNELTTLQEKVNSGSSLTTSVESNINTLSAAIGTEAVQGEGVSITITTDSNLLYYDLIDLINELFVTGAEAVSINDVRITDNTLISEVYDIDHYSIVINGNPLLSPVVIKAVGDPATLEKGLTYSGGIIDNLNILYQVYPVIKQQELVKIPAAKLDVFTYAKPVEDNQKSE